MVLDEIQYDKVKKAPTSGSVPPNGEDSPLESRLADPWDRVAASVADFVLFLPMMAVAIAPFRRHAVEAQITGQDDAWSIALIGAACAAALSLVLYQTFFIAWWGATPGKRVLGLRVETLWGEKGEKPRPLVALIRACAWCAEVLCMGLPWLAVFSNERRRSFHDRVADTVVVTSKQRRAVQPPSQPVRSMAAGVTSAVLVCFSFILTVHVLRVQSPDKSSDVAIADFEESGVLCTQVGESHREWIAGQSDSPTRIEVALALYGADAIDDDCLRLEAEHVFWQNEGQTLGYLAKAFTEASDQDLYESYLNKVCEVETESDACRLVQILQDPREETAESAEKKAAIADFENQTEAHLASVSEKSSAFLRVWAIRHFMESHRPGRALEIIDTLSTQKKLGYFLARERAKALWQVERKEDARIAMRTVIDTFDIGERVELARWFCLNETSEDGCTEASQVSCGLLDSAVSSGEEWLSEPGVAAVYLRGLSCQAGLTKERLSEIEQKMPDTEAKDFVKALGLLAKRKRDEAISLFKEIAASAQKQGLFFIEANAKLADLARDEAELEPVMESWIATDPGEEGWDFLAYRLMERFNSLKAWDKTLEVGLRLVQADSVNRKATRSLVVAAFRSGNSRMAFGFLHKLNQDTNLETKQISGLASRPASQPYNERVPASQADKESSSSFDEFEEVAAEMMNSSEFAHDENRDEQ